MINLANATTKRIYESNLHGHLRFRTMGLDNHDSSFICVGRDKMIVEDAYFDEEL